MPPGCRNDVEALSCSRNRTEATASLEGEQFRGGAVWRRGFKGGGACSTARPSASCGRHLAHPNGPVPRLQHCQTATCARGRGRVCTSTYAVRRQVLRGEPRSRFFQVDVRERYKINCYGGVRQGDVSGQALSCMPIRPMPDQLREEFEA